VCFDAQDWDALDEAARGCGVSVGEFVRAAAVQSARAARAQSAAVRESASALRAQAAHARGRSRVLIDAAAASIDIRPRCTECAEVIGVYEPVRVEHPDGALERSSLLALGAVRAAAARLAHADCPPRA